ncbi:MAG: hypothetical protein DLM65_05715 [Candidatus Aeolococcus gillhamiae]|uniref:Exo-alpha-sialidase n=1 Tax=Candidatus Aeolococcus gillhamiae TaxID=3127015 RepID=A0A2W5Z851_9BACT|nr:MAG: hypothetical protein DLM65_05715 [Candidatus Dormibacter sp. RRmetagenome_bin12]
MKRRIASVVFGAIVLASGTLILTGGGGTPASAGNAILKSRFINRISGYIVQDLTQGQTNGSAQPRSAAAGRAASSIAPLTPTLSTTGCSEVSGTNVRVNQDCTNNSVPRYAGRGQAQNETAIAVNPTNPQNLLAGQNDYRRGDGTCGADFSIDGGQHWGNTLLPIGFSVPGFEKQPSTRHYWTSSGDPSVAYDTSGAAYYTCGAFDRSYPTNDAAACPNPGGSCASGLFVFRSVDGGASWNFPGGSQASGGSGQVIVTPGVSGASGQFTLEDKQYMAIDAHPSSAYRDRIYVAWTHYTPCPGTAGKSACETAAVYLSYSFNHGQSFSTPTPISGSSPSLCQVPLDPATAHACDNNSFAQPVVAANGDVYVVFANYNNAVSGNDNHNNVLVVKSTNGAQSFGGPHLVTRFNDLPDCVTYTGGDAFRACVPTAPLSDVSIFRAADYPSAAADPTDPSKIYVTFGSYINPHSNPGNPAGQGHCVPQGLNATTVLNLYNGVGDVNGCNNDILLSTTTDGGTTWSGVSNGLEHATVVSDESGQLADQWWQWAATNSAGQLAVSYYDRKYSGDENNGSNDVSLAASHGAAFNHTRVTSVSNPPATEFPDGPNAYSDFLGDYSGLAVSGTTAYPIWSDTRNGEFYQCYSTTDPLGTCRVTSGSIQGFDEDVFTTHGLALP